MKEAINFSQVPKHYTMCLNKECPKAESCLRQYAAQLIPADVISWNILSPKRLALNKDECSYYKPDTKTRYAKGFKKILNDLPYKQMQTVVFHLSRWFGRTMYYRVRRGERLLSPAEQQEFLKLLKNCGVTNQIEFDMYVEEYEW